MSGLRPLLFAVAWMVLGHGALAQSPPANPAFTYGLVPTVGQWNYWFMQKQDLLNFVPLSTGGGTLTGRLNTLPSSTLGSGLNIGQSVAPTSPVNGDVWMTVSGMFYRANGVTASVGNNVLTTPNTWLYQQTFSLAPTVSAFGTAGIVNNNSAGVLSTSTLSSLLDSNYGTAQGSVLYRGASGWSELIPGTSGFFLETQGASANPTWAAASGGSGCTTGGSAGNMLTASGSGGCVTVTPSTLVNGALSLGSSGTLGSVQMGNTTSGTVTVQPTTGALGTAIATLPANTGLLAELNLAQTWTGIQTFSSAPVVAAFGISGTVTNSSAGSLATSPLFDVVAAGADYTDATDSSGVFQAVLTSATAAGGQMHIPCGTYELSNASFISATIASGASLYINGDGRDCVRLESTNGVGFSLVLGSNESSVHISNLTLCTLQAGPNSNASIGFALEGPNYSASPAYNATNDMNNVSIQGCDRTAVTGSDYWGYAVYSNDISNFNIDALSVYSDVSNIHGIGILDFASQLTCTGGTPCIAGVMNISHSNFLQTNYGFELGVYAQGVTIGPGVNFTGGNEGIYSPAGTTGVSELQILFSQFNTVVGAQIDIEGAVPGLFAIGNDIAPIAGQTGIVDNGNQFVIIGNLINGGGSTASAIEIGNNLAVNDGYIGGNPISNLGTGIGVFAGNGSGIMIAPNNYVNVTTPVADANSGDIVAVSCPAGVTAANVRVVFGVFTRCS